jgi:hypothetical protein
MEMTSKFVGGKVCAKEDVDDDIKNNVSAPESNKLMIWGYYIKNCLTAGATGCPGLEDGALYKRDCQTHMAFLQPILFIPMRKLCGYTFQTCTSFPHQFITFFTGVPQFLI